MRLTFILRVASGVSAPALLGVFLAASAVAQDYRPDPALAALGENIWKTQAECRNCHGSMANGVGDMPQDPQGPNLRRTILTPEQLAEVVKCGRIGSDMPHFDRRAYTDDRCYGVTAADLGDRVPPTGSPLSQRQIDAVVAFLVTKFVGQPDPTYQECVAFWGEDASGCAKYPR